MKKPDLWLTYAFNPSFGAWIAIASTKHPVLGDDKVDVVAHSFCASEEECRAWFERLKRSSHSAA